MTAYSFFTDITGQLVHRNMPDQIIDKVQRGIYKFGCMIIDGQLADDLFITAFIIHFLDAVGLSFLNRDDCFDRIVFIVTDTGRPADRPAIGMVDAILLHQ